MRPQRFSCGISRADGSAGNNGESFNEAAAFQLRNLRRRRRSGRAAPGFNEAAAFQLRNHEQHEHREIAEQASMRPQRFSCGIQLNSEARADHSTSFNEAAAFQLRNHHVRVRIVRRHGGFNEAAAFQLRNPSHGHEFYVLNSSLQ